MLTNHIETISTKWQGFSMKIAVAFYAPLLALLLICMMGLVHMAAFAIEIFQTGAKTNSE